MLLPLGHANIGLALQLASTIGNAAFTSIVLQRDLSLSRALSARDRQRAEALEARLRTLTTGASQRAQTILAHSDAAVGDLRAATDHLSRAGASYRQGHDTFLGVLRRADAEYESDKAVADAVQGLVIATALGLILPETLATMAALAVARQLVASTSTRLTAAGIAVAKASHGVAGAAADAAAGELAEVVTGAGVSTTTTDTGRPSDSADNAGPSSSDRFAEIVGHLSRLGLAMPALGAVGNSQWQLAHAAESTAGDSARLRAGDSLQVTLDQLEARLTELAAADTLGAQALGLARDQQNTMAILKNQALVVPLKTPVEFEDHLWTAWIASLTTSSSNEMLDNDVIEGYLGPGGKNMFDFGRYTSDSDQAEAVVAAQRRWLLARGIQPYSSTSSVLSQYKREQALDRIRAEVVGREGTLLDSGRLTLGTTVYRYARNAGTFPPGTRMLALHVVVVPHMQGEVLIDRWTPDLFDVYCNPVTPRPDVPAGSP